jgi:hypothetical protein
MVTTTQAGALAFDAAMIVLVPYLFFTALGRCRATAARISSFSSGDDVIGAAAFSDTDRLPGQESRSGVDVTRASRLGWPLGVSRITINNNSAGNGGEERGGFFFSIFFFFSFFFFLFIMTHSVYIFSWGHHMGLKIEKHNQSSALHGPGSASLIFAPRLQKL